MTVAIFVLVSLAFIGGLGFGCWLKDLPPPPVLHELCDERLERTVQVYEKEIASRESYIQSLIAEREAL